MSDTTRRAFVTAAAGYTVLPAFAQTKGKQPAKSTDKHPEGTPTEDKKKLGIYDLALFSKEPPPGWR